MDRQQAVERINSVWDKSPAGTLCLALIDLIGNGVLHRLTFTQLGRLASKLSAEKGDVAQAIQYLTGHDLHLLDLEFEFVDEEDQTFYFDARAIELARQEGALFHPETGGQIEDYEDRVFVTFVPSSLAKEILRGE